MYTIGQISEMFHLPISTLRYYDKEGNKDSLKTLPSDNMPEDIKRAYQNTFSEDPK